MFNEDGFGSDFHVTFKATAHTRTVQYREHTRTVQFTGTHKVGSAVWYECSKARLLYTQAPKLTHTHIAYPAE